MIHTVPYTTKTTQPVLHIIKSFVTNPKRTSLVLKKIRFCPKGLKS